MKRILILIACFILFSSHELFLKSDNYFLKDNAESELYLFNGTFDKSENTISRDRIVSALILGPDYNFLPAEEDYYDNGEVTFLKFKTGNEGTYVAGISTLPRVIELTANEFLEYLEHEGLTHMISERQAKEIHHQPAKEEYSKHVKAILQVGDEKSPHFNTVFGYPIEFVPLSNPYQIKTGDRLAFKLLLDGKPLKNQTVHYSSRNSTRSQDDSEGSTSTDDQGIFVIYINKPGIWYVASIHMEESEKEGIDYVSKWATLTFEVAYI